MINIFKIITEAPVKRVTLITIDFNKPWWHVFLHQKSSIAIAIISTLIFNTLDTLFPILIGWALNSDNIYHVALIIGIYIIDESSSWFFWNPRMIQLYTQTAESFRYSAYLTLLSIDPIYHTQQSSGVALGKIRRTREAYIDITKNMFEELIPLIVSLIATVAALTNFSIYLGIIVGISMLIVAITFGWWVIAQTELLEKKANYEDDRANHVGTESIIQAQFIRSTFASNQIRTSLIHYYTNSLQSMTRLYMTYRFMRSLSIISYTFGIGCVATYLWTMIHNGTLSPMIALALIGTILRSTQPLLKIDSRVREFVSAYRKIDDFYEFIKKFGHQSFPVFSSTSQEQARIIKNNDTINFAINNVTVGYPLHKPLFTNLNVSITTSRANENKLYGIIGPSGIGKTTIVSLIGGQLKPQSGTVTINGYNIYQLHDQERQHLISLQGQTATNLHGTLHYNITFGLPSNHKYSDNDLIEVLHAVGLWQLFEEKHGLQTLVGEGGTTLSGGQRQRLNFANLYLRAKIYQPAIILIDEPTSSLDAISEQKITDMITQLAKNSLTLVIAHRLTTIQNAQGIMDFCMLSENKELNFYSHEELMEKSYYYKQLITGTAHLENQ